MFPVLFWLAAKVEAADENESVEDGPEQIRFWWCKSRAESLPRGECGPSDIEFGEQETGVEKQDYPVIDVMGPCHQAEKTAHAISGAKATYTELCGV